MTISTTLADRALAPVTAAEAAHLRTLTLVNVAAGLGANGRWDELLDSLPLPAGPASRAFLLAALMHARTQDDYYPVGKVHVGSLVVPTVLALAAQTRDRLIESLAAGYRVMGLVSSAYTATAQRCGLRPTGLFGPIGAAAAAAAALGLDRSRFATALALASGTSAGTNQSWISGTDEWLVQVANAARSGVESALFAQAGVAAAEDAFEGRAGWAAAYFNDPGAARLRETLAGELSPVTGVAAKPYPVSGIAVLPTELARRAHEQLGGRRSDAVRVYVSPTELAYPGSSNRGPFRSRSDALMSIAFGVAAALNEGNVTLAALDAPNGPEIRATIERIELVADPNLPESHARLELISAGGTLQLACSGDEIFYPSWEETMRDAELIAERSEAPAAAVRRAAEVLGRPAPDAMELDAVFVRRTNVPVMP